MHGFKRHLGVAVALACSLAVVTGTALAAPPSSPPGQEKNAEPAAAPAGQSQQAPGQEQKADPSAPAVAAAESPAPAKANKGQEQKAAKASSSSSTQVKTQGINSTSAGVKPSNDTDKHTSCKTGGSMPSPTCTREDHGSLPPDSSKRYGNGTTAAQIAVGRGAPTDTEIRGPGNSQPHKVCKKVTKSGKEVWADVHSVKSWPTCVTTPSTTNVVPPARNVVAPTTSATGAAVGAAVATGAVAGAHGELGESSESSPGVAGGVQGAFGVLGAAGTLPFTGFPLWAVVLLGVAAIAVGLTLRRRTRPALRSLA